MAGDVRQRVPLAAPAGPAVPAADIAALRFETTRELTPLREFADQPRAHEAIRFGTEMSVRGFNIFAIGANGARIQSSVRALLEDAATQASQAADWVYVNNFATPHRPVAIALPSGRAPAWTRRSIDLIDDLKVSLPAAFESEDYQKRRGGIEQEIRGKNERAFTALRDKATAKGIAILRTPMGFAMAPMKDGQVVPPAEFNAWTAGTPARGAGGDRGTGKGAGGDTARVATPGARHSVTRCARWIARPRASRSRSRSRSAGRSSPTCRRCVQHLDAIQADILENVALFIAPQATGEEATQTGMRPGSLFDRYEVNVLVTPDGRRRPAHRWSRRCIRH